MRVSRRQTAVAGVAAGALVAFAVAFPRIVRARVAAEASRRHVAISVDRVRPGWFAVRLLGVRVRLDGVDAVALSLDEVRVGIRAGASVESVCVTGGLVEIDGSPEQVIQSLRAWRSKSSPEAPAAQQLAPHPLTRADGLRVQWRFSGSELNAVAVGGSRTDAGYDIALDELSLASARGAFRVRQAGASLTPTAEILSFRAKSLVAELARSAEEERPEASADPRTTASIEPPTVPVAVPRSTGKRTHEARSAVDQPVPPAPLQPFLPLEKIRLLREAEHELARAVAARLAPDGAVDIDELSLTSPRAAGTVTLGPGAFALHRRADSLELDFTTARDAGGTPLTLHTTLPLEDGDAVVSLEGGPVALASLGLKDGTLGLDGADHATAAGKARLVLASDSLTFDVDARVRGLGIKQPKLASEPLRGIDAALSARGILSKSGELRLDEFTATFGALHVSASGVVEQGNDFAVARFHFDVPTAACEALLESMPTALFPELRGARYQGTLGARGDVAVDSRDLDALKLDYAVDDRCRMNDVPPLLQRERFKQPFQHRVYLPDGSTTDENTGPGTSSWVPLGGISPFMPVAVLTTEDGAFYGHHGFAHRAIKSSIIANLKARKFLRGASTISMQLAKNLFLTREKTLSRKLEEMILTDYIEQVFTKDEIMELYLNVIEFGPNIYGIGPAARYYFGRNPLELNLAECLFLSSLLPAPLRLSNLKSQGQLSEGWQHTIAHLMTIAKKYNLISDEELEEGKGELVVFGNTGPRALPRRHSKLDGSGVDGDDGPAVSPADETN